MAFSLETLSLDELLKTLKIQFEDYQIYPSSCDLYLSRALNLPIQGPRTEASAVCNLWLLFKSLWFFMFNRLKRILISGSTNGSLIAPMPQLHLLQPNPDGIQYLPNHHICAMSPEVSSLPISSDQPPQTTSI
jgi:hypothetical protein